MKISSSFHEIKGLTTATVIGLCGLCGLLAPAGCAAPVLEASFSARPDASIPGSLLGPFDGQVVDAATGHPIAGAMVFASWGLEIGRGLTAPAGGDSVTVETDSDGRYFIDARTSLGGRRARMTRFTLIVYKHGFVGYRSDRRYDDLSPRQDFAQQHNLCRLERFPAGASHVRHVRFVGGAGPLRRALWAETVQASLELSGGGPEAVPGLAGALLDAGVLLSIDELKAVTAYHGEFTVERLADLPQSPTYDSRHFRANGKPESFDAAVRVWKLDRPAAADARFEALVKEIPNVEARDEIGDRSVRGYDGKILAAATLDRTHGVVIELTCGVDQCRDIAQVVALLRRVLGRSERLGQATAPEGTTPAPKKEEPEPSAEPAPTEAPEENPFRLRPPELHR